MEDERILAALRAMAWERGKAELLSINQARYGDSEKSKKWANTLDSFIAEVEAWELYN